MKERFSFLLRCNRCFFFITTVKLKQFTLFFSCYGATGVSYNLIGKPANARVYIAGRKPFGGDRAILPLQAEFDNVVKKEMLARDGDLDHYKNRSTILTTIDYIVSLSSDVFLPSYHGHMGTSLAGASSVCWTQFFSQGQLISWGNHSQEVRGDTET
ncbi:O-fucosyltransferase 37-like [Rutidosis leptorrhynchoides]|uniref:O-fucosyltransferase 37-like n=1 Tax=Rutidosis leptorrhynchoides TaxID=125765 RepID=UPI003A98DFF3